MFPSEDFGCVTCLKDMNKKYKKHDYSNRRISLFIRTNGKPHYASLTQAVSQPNNLDYSECGHFVQKVRQFIVLEMFLYLTIMDFEIFRIKVW